MKKFITWTLIFMLPVFLAGFAYELLLRRIPNDYMLKKQYLDENAHRVKTLFLGSSHTFYGINPDFFPGTSFNAGYVFQSLDLDLAILEKYADRWDSLQQIVVPVDYFSLYARMSTGSEAWRVKNYNLYWGLKRSNNIVENSEVLTNPLNTNSKRFLGHYLYHESFITSSEKGWGMGYDSTRELDISGKSAAERHLAANDKQVSKNLEYLTRILDFAAARKVKVILITSPAWRAYVENLDPVQLGRTTRAADSLAARYSNTVYFNRLADSSFTAEDFYDGDHLNSRGAKKFTLKLDSMIRSAE